MGLFSINYNKPGPGVDKDAPPKPRFFVFFEVLKRKFWHLIKVNLLFVLTNILALPLAFFVASVFLQKIEVDGGFGDLFLRVFIAMFMVMLPLVTIGPVHAGYTYTLRNYSREEHSFIWWDFKENFVRNFKQGMIITVIDLVVMYLLGIALIFYTSSGNIISVVATSFVVLSLLIFSMMHLYIYPMLVTVNLTIKDLYKNALIFSIIKLFPNLLFIILNFVIAFAAFYNIIIGIILYIFILPSFIGLMNNFYVNPIIKKYVIDPMLPPPEEEEDEDDNDEDEGTGFYKPLKEVDEDDEDK